MVEIMVGVIILALVLIPSLWVLISNAQSITSTRDHVMAGFIAQRILETIRTCPFDMLDQDQTFSVTGNEKKTLEYDMNHDDATPDRIPLSEKINNITYFLKEGKVEYGKSAADTTQKLHVAYISFKIEYQGLDGKSHRLDIQTAVTK